MNAAILKNKPLLAAYGCSVLFFLIQFLPYIFRSDFYIRIHDTLEGEWIWYSSIVDYGVALNYDMDTMIPSFLGGIPRYLFPSGLSFTVLFIKLFGTAGGYVVSSFVIRVVGFTGVYFLCKNYIFTDKDQRHWAVWMAALFSLIPFFITFGISASGMPLLLLAFLNILNRKTRIWEYFFILAFPFYANIVWTALYINLALFVVLWFMYSKRLDAWRFFGMLGLMNVLFLVVNYHLIYAMFLSGVPLQRLEYDLTYNTPPGLWKSIGETIYMFFACHFHVGTFVTLPIFLLGCLSIHRKVVKYLLIAVLLIALLNGFYLWLVPTLHKIHPMLVSFNIKRVKLLLPFLWILVFAFSVKELIRFPKGERLSYFVLACLLVSTLFANDEIVHNYRNILGFQRKPDVKQFFAAHTLEDIAEFIGKDKSTYRVAHLGMNPTISQANGFQTIDGLQAIYPLEHKYLVESVIKGELAKDEKLVRYFVAWGNRCYLFSSELGKKNTAFMVDKTQDRSVSHWDINTLLLKTQGVEYIFSTVKILNAAELGIQLEGSFEHEGEFWRIYLYKII